MTEPNGRLARRLRRILALLPYVIRNPGVSVADLAELFSVPKQDLIDDLKLVFLCGLPGYGPGDLIDVSIEGDRVFVSMADYFSAPLRLTPAEALSLYAAAEALAGLPGMEGADALRRAAAKLGTALGASDDRSDAATTLKLEVDQSPHLGALEEALARSVRIELEYLSASRGELSRRLVDPWGLFAALGHWYLIARDHASSEERMFRTDRIKRVRPSDVPAEIPDDFDPERYRGAFLGRGDIELYIEISPEATAWFEDYYPIRSKKQLRDGWTGVTLSAGGTRWAAVQVLKLGAHARAVRPQTVVEEAGKLAGRLAARYRA